MTLAEMSPTKIHNALNVLVGLPMRTFGRAANLIWLCFGESHEVPSRLGGTKIVNDWALHLQCSWRLCKDGRIEVADLDCYRDALDEYLEDWDEPGKSRFGDYAVTFRLSLEAGLIFVEAVSVDDVGGFSLSLTGGLRLDVFPNNAGGKKAVEHWRLFEPWTESRHFVVFEDPDD